MRNYNGNEPVPVQEMDTQSQLTRNDVEKYPSFQEWII